MFVCYNPFNPNSTHLAFVLSCHVNFVLEIADPNPLTSCWVHVVLLCPFVNSHPVSCCVRIRVRVRILLTLYTPHMYVEL